MIHRIHSATTFLASFALVIAGCGGGGSSGPPTRLSEALLDAIHRNCRKAFDCKSSYVSAMHNNRSFEDYVSGSTVDACDNSVKTLLLTFRGQDYLTKIDESVSAGRIDYNPNDYETCLAAVEAETCDQFFHQNGATESPPRECDTIEVGRVPSAGACTLDEDCAIAGDACNATPNTCG
ncbi:MAG TPA: hypothetical protein VGD80_23180 [Kofleriaceae bacterium]